MAQELLKISQSDLGSAEILYSKGHYGQAVFSFQQSVEKLSKSFGLFAGIIKENELKGRSGIGHEGTKIFEKHYSNVEKDYQIIYEKVMNSPNPPNKSVMKAMGILQAINQAKRISKKLEKFRNDSIGLVFVPAKEIREVFEEVDKEYGKILGRPFVKTEFNEYVKTVSGVLDSLEYLNPSKVQEEKAKLIAMDMKEFETKYYAKIKMNIAKFLRLYLTLFFLNIIVLPHSSLSRYPELEVQHSPSKVYTKKLPLVKSLPYLIERQREAILEYKSLIKIANKNNKEVKTS